ncbi:hypothetical protein BDQ17DRAFT_1407320, partial [Cyathus striatus]
MDTRRSIPDIGDRPQTKIADKPNASSTFSQLKLNITSRFSRLLKLAFSSLYQEGWKEKLVSELAAFSTQQVKFLSLSGFGSRLGRRNDSVSVVQLAGAAWETKISHYHRAQSTFTVTSLKVELRVSNYSRRKLHSSETTMTTSGNENIDKRAYGGRSILSLFLLSQLFREMPLRYGNNLLQYIMYFVCQSSLFFIEMDSAGLLSETFITILEHNQGVRYMNVASIALLCYDYCLTLNMEMKLIWPSRWNSIKILFLLVRYTPYIDSAFLFYNHFGANVSPESCLIAYKANGWLYFIGAFLAETLLTIRTWSVWKEKPIVKFGFPVFFISIWIAIWIIIVKFVSAFQFSHTPYPGYVVVGGSAIPFVFWILLMVFHSGALILMGLRAFKSCQMGVTSDLVKIVYRDGVTYYFYLFVMSLISVVLGLKLSRDFVGLLLYITRTMHAIFSCRVVLHARSRGERSLG